MPPKTAAKAYINHNGKEILGYLYEFMHRDVHFEPTDADEVQLNYGHSPIHR